MFPSNEDSLEERGFSKLHQAVVKLIYCDFESYVTTHKSLIDSTDSTGTTALSWAVRRGDREASRILVKAGADTNIVNKADESALHYAARYSDLESVSLLLKAGANPHQCDAMGDSVLHIKGYSARFATGVVQRLIEAGVDPNARNHYGASPLHMFASQNGVEAAEALIRNGANINQLDDDGDSILLQAIHSAVDDVAQLLLSYEAAYTSWDSMGNSILHDAALSGGLRTIDILRNAKLHGVDPDALNRQGKTVLQLALARNLKPEGFVEKLQGLLVEIRMRNADLRRANSHDHPKTANDQSHCFVKHLTSFKTRFQAQLSQLARTMPYSTTFRVWIRTCLLLAATYFAFSYLSSALRFGQVVQSLTCVWSMLGPADFVEL